MPKGTTPLGGGSNGRPSAKKRGKKGIRKKKGGSTRKRGDRMFNFRSKMRGGTGWVAPDSAKAGPLPTQKKKRTGVEQKNIGAKKVAKSSPAKEESLKKKSLGLTSFFSMTGGKKTQARVGVNGRVTKGEIKKKNGEGLKSSKRKKLQKPPKKEGRANRSEHGRTKRGPRGIHVFKTRGG